jgi:hypothetical protein
MDQRVPADGIRRHREIIDPLSDDQLIARIAATEPLPDADDDDPAWNQDETWDRMEFLLAAADAIGERRLLGAVAPLFQRAALGHGYGMMQAFRHGPEAAAAPDWAALTAIMRPLTRDQHAGCRRWAVRELGILRDPDALDDLLTATQDQQPQVRSEACDSLGLLGQDVPATRPAMLDRLTRTAQHDTAREVRRSALAAIERIT